LVSAAAPALAQQDPARGRALFNEGVALYNDGKYAEACAKLEASLQALPGLGTRGKLGECYEKLGKYASAWSMYREVAQLAGRAGDATREQVASERAKALEPKLSYVTVTISPANDLPGLVVKRNGKELDRAKVGAADPVDPGLVTIEVTVPNKKPFTTQVTVAAGQTSKIDVPPLESAVAAPPPPPPESRKEVPYFPPPESESTPWQKPVGLAIAGAGALGMAVGGLFGLSARSTYNDAFDGGGCDRATKECDAAGQSSVDDARSKATMSTIFFVAGGALAAGGLVLFFTAPSGKRTGVRVAPSGSASGGVLSLSGSM
jgi:hypothetical protein